MYFKEDNFRAFVTPYIQNPITNITSFLGLPNSLPAGAKEQSWSNIAKQCIGWQDEVTLERAFINGFMIFPNIILRLAVFAPTVALNTVKLVTEFAPRVLLAKCFTLVKNANENNSAKSIAYYAAKAGGYLASAWSFIGGAITSPLNNVRVAWKKGEKIANDEIKELTNIKSKNQAITSEQFNKDCADIRVAGKVLGGALAVMSMALTVAFVAVALPYTVISAATTVVGSSWTFGGLAVGACLVAESIVTALDRGIEKFKNFWRKSGKEKVKVDPSSQPVRGSTVVIKAKTVFLGTSERPNINDQTRAPVDKLGLPATVQPKQPEQQPQSRQTRSAT